MLGKKIGIAGYMGSGKTTCARLLARGHARIIDADAEAKALMATDTELRGRLRAAFGGSIIESGAISFRELGRVVFGAKSELVKLNGIVHPPLVRRLCELVGQGGGAQRILDAALIPLWGAERWFDVCLWIDASFDRRLHRLKEKYRDLDEASLRNRMRVQEELMPAPGGPPWIRVVNEGSLEELAAAVVSMRGLLAGPAAREGQMGGKGSVQ
jgi:dephospho-CoA kinase